MNMSEHIIPKIQSGDITHIQDHVSIDVSLRITITTCAVIATHPKDDFPIYIWFHPPYAVFGRHLVIPSKLYFDYAF